MDQEKNFFKKCLHFFFFVGSLHHLEKYAFLLSDPILMTVVKHITGPLNMHKVVKQPSS